MKTSGYPGSVSRRRGVVGALAVSVAALLNACGEDPMGPGTRELNTASYFDDAIVRDADGSPRLMSWRGTSQDGAGVLVRMNVYDGASTGFSETQRWMVQDAIQNAREVWVAALRRALVDELGVTDVANVNIAITWESLGHQPFEEVPYIDLRFVDMIDGGKKGGLATLFFDSERRVWDRLEIKIAKRTATRAMEERDYRTVAAHEIGHALGIFGIGDGEGHSPNENDIMYPTSRWETLSEGDYLTLRDIYSRQPSYTFLGGNPSPVGEVCIRNDAPFDVGIRILGVTRVLFPNGDSLCPTLRGEETLSIWECPVGQACRWDDYTVAPSGEYPATARYAVVHLGGNDLALVPVP